MAKWEGERGVKILLPTQLVYGKKRTGEQLLAGKLKEKAERGLVPSFGLCVGFIT